MRASNRGRRCRRILVLLLLFMAGDLAGATRVVDPSRLPSFTELASLTALPSLPSLPAFASLPAVPSLSSLPRLPSLPAVPSLSSLPRLSSVPSLSSLTSPSARSSPLETEPRLDTRGELSGEIDRLERRMDRAEAEGRRILSYHEEHVEPLVSLLEPHVRDHREVLPRVALALVREGHHVGVDPRLLGGVLLIENPWLDATIRSPVGAVGIMQVMPFHAGDWGCAGADLTDIETNVCHGTRILAEALRSSRGDLDAALLLYNGCREGTNTPDCHEYPGRVQAHIGTRGAGGEAAR